VFSQPRKDFTKGLWGAGAKLENVEDLPGGDDRRKNRKESTPSTVIESTSPPCPLRIKEIQATRRATAGIQILGSKPCCLTETHNNDLGDSWPTIRIRTSPGGASGRYRASHTRTALSRFATSWHTLDWLSTAPRRSWLDPGDSFRGAEWYRLSAVNFDELTIR
jgi:hypothetical protein